MPEVVAYARQMVSAFEARHPDLNVYMTGSVMLGNAFAEAAQHDMATLVPIMFLVIAITLWLLLRSITGTLATMLVITLSIICAMGMFGWLGWTLTGPSSGAPTVITTMAVADCVHILVSFLYNLRHGMTKEKAMQESLRINLQPVFITSLTTVLGFMTMNFSEVPPFRDLGNTVAMGVVAAFFLSILFLPALVLVLPVRPPRQVAEHKRRRVDGLGDYVIAHRRKVLIGSVLVSALLFVGIPLNQINDEFVGYFKTSVQFRQDTDFTAAHLTGIYTMEYSLLSGQSDGISDPEFLRQVEAFSEFVEGHPEVVHVETITDIFKRLNRNMHADEASWYRLPEDRELAAQYLLLYEMSLPYGLDLNNQLNVDKSSVKIRITLRNISSRRTLQLEREFADWLNTQTSFEQFFAASPNIMFSHIGERNVHSMVSGVVYALLIICLIMTLVLKSLKLGVVSMIPNLVPIGAAFGIWGLAHGDVGISVGTSVGMILGIVIDDTVHFLSKYQRARREKGYDAEQAIRYAFSTVGTALWVTTFVLVAGFLVLAMSDFNMNAYMGVFTAITIALALVFDFLALPALLLWMESRKPFTDEPGRAPEVPATAGDATRSG
jgi:predicted RND superfamily exporter protein